MCAVKRNQTDQLPPDACDALYKILNFDGKQVSLKPLKSSRATDGVDGVRVTLPKLLVSAIMQRFLRKVREIGGETEYQHLYQLLITSKRAKKIQPRFELFISVILIMFAPTDWQTGLLDLVSPSDVAHEVFGYLQRYGINNQTLDHLKNTEFLLKKLDEDITTELAKQKATQKRQYTQLSNAIGGFGEAQLMLLLANSQDLLRLFEIIRGDQNFALSQHVAADKKYGYNASDLNNKNTTKYLKNVLGDQTYRNLRSLADFLYEDTRNRRIKRKRKVFIENDEKKG